MKETGVIFNTAMVQADLDGRKTNTRRTRGLEKINQYPDQWLCDGKMNDNGLFTFASDQFHKEIDVKCPYGQPGDLIYVRETWKPELVNREGKAYSYYYLADNPQAKSTVNKFKPSIHMPKEAARIWKKIISVRPERLQDISNEDAIAEGIRCKTCRISGETGYLAPNRTDNAKFESAVKAFKSLWRSINGPDSWEANPWVWRIEYEIISTTSRPQILP